MPTSAKKRAVFLDRDGVLNAVTVQDQTPYPPHNVHEVHVLPRVSEALQTLKRLGFLLIVVTNQPDVARGTQTVAGVEAINATLAKQLPLDEFRVCYHDDADQCDCRKPKPGLLLAAAKARDIDLPASFLVGDRSGDILAGAAAGCRTFLVQRPYSNAAKCKPDFTVSDLSEAAQIIAAFPLIPSPGNPGEG
jgi:D-glycero-D-manno-heptose 1,7-bisphosphate phosphatase